MLSSLLQFGTETISDALIQRWASLASDPFRPCAPVPCASKESALHQDALRPGYARRSSQKGLNLYMTKTTGHVRETLLFSWLCWSRLREMCLTFVPAAFSLPTPHRYLT